MRRIEELLEQEVARGGIAGGNVICVQDGKEIFYHEAGYCDIERKLPIHRDTIFRLYSMSKPITSAAVMLLVERGELDLLTPVYEYLPGFAHQRYYDEYQLKNVAWPMNIKNLMSMTSGLVYPGEMTETEKDTKVIFDRLTDGLHEDNEFASYGTVEAMNDLGKMPLAFSPGAHWNYGASADVLGAIIEVVSGMPFSEFLRKNLWEPLEMKDTGFYVPQEKQIRLARSYEATADGLKEYTGDHLAIRNRMEKAPAFESGGAGMCSTIDDYMNFNQMLMNKGIYKGRKIMREKTIDFMTSGQLTQEQQKTFNWDSLEGYSYGNLLRVMKWPENGTHLSTYGEYGWDGWLGAYMMNVPKEKLSFILMYQKKDAGTTSFTRRMKNVLYSTLKNGE